GPPPSRIRTWPTMPTRAMIRKGTAPAVDYGIKPSDDGRFEIVWKSAKTASTTDEVETVFDFRPPRARGRAHAPREGKCWRFYAPADPLQAALRLAPLIIPMV